MQNERIPVNQSTRRRKRTKMQIFKEAYLPTIILAVTIVLVLVFIIGGSIKRHNTNETISTEPPANSTPSTQDPQLLVWEKEAVQLIIRADGLAKNYDYEGAIAALDGFSGDASLFPALQEARDKYTAALESMVAWSAADVPNLSFHLLIADPGRAFPDNQYGSSYKRNFVTVDEFSAILQQLYDNGYVLVDLDNFYTSEYSSTSGREVMKQLQLMLPEGKKPIMITETNVNYYSYMIDSNNDGKPDAGADGFASRLCWDGDFYNELVNADGSVSYGAYDLVPILEAFIAAHPDFSYKGARATIAFSGYDGILGYRINSTTLSEDQLQAEREGAAAIVKALQDAGYKLACYTYNNMNYNTNDAAAIQADLKKWEERITPWVGKLDILVFARDTDISNTDEYSGAKFNVLYNAGFRYFMGMGVTDGAWNQVTDLYVRQNRIGVTGYNMINNAGWFEGMFDPTTVLDSARS